MTAEPRSRAARPKDAAEFTCRKCKATLPRAHFTPSNLLRVSKYVCSSCVTENNKSYLKHDVFLPAASEMKRRERLVLVGGVAVAGAAAAAS